MYHIKLFIVIARPDISTSFYLYYDCIITVGIALLNLTCLSIQSLLFDELCFIIINVMGIELGPLDQ